MKCVLRRHALRKASGRATRPELRLRIREIIALEARIAEMLAELDLARKELVDGHRDAAVQYSQSLGAIDTAAIESALSALGKAAEYFDHTRGYRFMTYAEHWIEEAINHHQSQP